MNGMDLQRTKSKAKIHFHQRKVRSKSAKEVKNLVIKVVILTSTFRSLDPMAQTITAEIEGGERKKQEEKWRKSESRRYKGLFIES